MIVAPTCFGLHKPSSGSSQPVLRQSYNVDIGYIYCYFKISVLCLHILLSPVMRVDVHCAEWNCSTLRSARRIISEEIHACWLLELNSCAYVLMHLQRMV